MISENKKYNIHAVILLSIGAIIRAIFIFFKNPPADYIFSDMKMYHDRAEKILNGIWEPTTFFQPIGWTLIEAFSFINFSQPYLFLSFLNLIASSLTMFFIWQASKNLLSERVSLVVLAISAFHFPFIYFSGFLLSECLFTFLISVFIWQVSRYDMPWNSKNSILLAVTFFLAFLLKGNFIFYPVILLLLLIWQNGLQAVKKLSIFFISFLILLSAHGLLTLSTIGKFQMSASNGGLNLVEGKCPYKYNVDPTGQWWQSPLFSMGGDEEKKHWPEPFTNSLYFTKQGLHCITENPTVLLESFRYIPNLFINNEMWPSLSSSSNPNFKITSKNYNLFFGFVMWPAILLSFFHLWSSRREKIFYSFVLPAISIFITVWVFKSEIRFRIPFDVVFIPLSVIGWDKLISTTFANTNEKHRFMIMYSFSFLVGSLVVFGLFVTS